MIESAQHAEITLGGRIGLLFRVSFQNITVYHRLDSEHV